jgi:hypothetical protein
MNVKILISSGEMNVLRAGPDRDMWAPRAG